MDWPWRVSGEELRMISSFVGFGGSSLSWFSLMLSSSTWSIWNSVDFVTLITSTYQEENPFCLAFQRSYRFDPICFF